MSSEGRPFAFEKYSMTAVVDKVTIAMPGKRDLPPLQGKPSWVRSKNYGELSVEDPTAEDVLVLSRCFPDHPLLYLEVAVDLSPKMSAGDAGRRSALVACFDGVARHLYPYSAPLMPGAVTTAYDPRIRKPLPFAYRSPSHVSQLLYGFRDDGPVQVVVYLKQTDQKANIPEEAHRVRIEVRCQPPACNTLGLMTLGGLFDFPFRRALSPYFRMVEAPISRVKRSRRKILKIVNGRVARARQERALRAWEKTGVQGALQFKGMRYKRLQTANQQIGKALGALEMRYVRKKLAASSLSSASSVAVASMA